MADRIYLDPALPMLIDYGNAPITFISGFAGVHLMDSVCKFALYERKTTILGGALQHLHEVVHNIIMPVDAVGPAIGMTIQALGSRLVPPMPRYMPRRLS